LLTKKKYAGWMIYKDGKEVDKISITGFESRRSDYPAVIRQFQTDLFNLILRGTPKWKKHLHAPLDISKIKIQGGDTVTLRNNNFIEAIVSVRHNELRYTTLSSFSNNDLYTSRISEYDINQMKIHGLFTPRYTAPQIQNMPRIDAIPNFHGGFTEASNFGIRIQR